jgi:RNA polymerase sigma factor (sigma-70 family)
MRLTRFSEKKIDATAGSRPISNKGVSRERGNILMPMKPRDRLLDHVRRMALRGLGERRSDGQLLEQFISERDETAFALLLRRHGPMVWSVCRRVLGNAHDADDAFQAAFLVLVRKAASVRPREAVGNWLYGVAYRTALATHKRIARRRAKEQSLQDVPTPESKSEEPWQELWPILDRELSRLADKYRLPIVLCDLEGRGRKEVARQLAIPEGTLSSRLDTARKKLAARLARLGFTLSGVSLAALLTEKTATAAIAPSLFTSTTKAAMLVAAGSAAVAGGVSATVATLTEGVLKTMFIAKIKSATLVFCGVAALGVGTGGVYYQTRAGAADSPPTYRVVQDNRKSSSEPGDREIDRLKRENEQLRGMLEKERSRQAVYREQLNGFVKQTTPAIEDAVRREAANQKPDPVQSLDQIAATQEALLRKKFQVHYESLRDAIQKLDAEQKDLQAQREKLEAQQRALLAQREKLQAELITLKQEYQRQFEDLADMKVKITRQQEVNRQARKEARKPAGGDKLDQILEGLERLEKRLDRLERGRQ